MEGQTTSSKVLKPVGDSEGHACLYVLNNAVVRLESIFILEH